ncbi:MAG TPA: acyl-CoA synthetase [Polyangia bacterium]|jgi:long-chain acyl-CoA synthetase|nr:acyl-CoA synthetase [Polyangia bacterium]
MSETGFWELAQRNPTRVALVDEHGTRRTAGELFKVTNQLVHGLRALGLQHGDTVATVLGNEAAMIEVAIATAQAGLYLVPINRNMAPPEIAYIVGDSEAKVLIASPSELDVIAKATADPAWKNDVALYATGGDHPRFKPYGDLMKGQPETAPADRKAGWLMNYTSGTTGRPKGVRRPLPPISPDILGQRYTMFLQLFGIKPSEGVHLIVSPLYHTAVLGFSMYHLHNGDTLVLMDKWTPERMLELIEQEKVTSTHMVPTHFSRLLALPEAKRSQHDLSSLRHMIHGAAPCPVEVKRRMLAWWGNCIYEYYAASEGGGTIISAADWLKKPGSVGKPWYGSEIRVLADDGTPSPVGTPGTVYIKMADYKFEYHKDKQKTDSAWKEGFFTVGDAGYLDADGYLFLCDRKSDMIISGGVNIYPAEIEGTLITHPAVRDVAVFGIPDDDWGEQVKAVIELQDGQTASPALVDDLRHFCGDKLAKHKIPKSIDFTEALPRDPSGKLYKRKLRDPYWQGRDRQI